jgi:hypothetical protein
MMTTREALQWALLRIDYRAIRYEGMGQYPSTYYEAKRLSEEPEPVKPYTPEQRAAIRDLAACLSMRAETIFKLDGPMSYAGGLLSSQARELGIIATGCDISGVV